MDAAPGGVPRQWHVVFAAYKAQGKSDEEARLLTNALFFVQQVNRGIAAAQSTANSSYLQEQQERYRREQDSRLRREQERRREQQQHHEAAQANDEGGEEDGEGHLDIYEQYRPAKVTEGPPHPDPIVETASLASVTPPDITYRHHLQENLERCELSNAQLETVLYAFQRFERRLPDGNRAGFFLGDGAGVGKGRQIAAVIKEFWATGGRRVLWVSTSNDLRYDARRDLSDLGVKETDIPVHPPRKDSVPAGNLDKIYPNGGVLFITYSLLVSKGSYKPPASTGKKGGRSSGGSGAAAAAGSGAAAGRSRGRGRGAGGEGGEGDDEAVERALEHKRAEVRRLFGAGSRLHQIVNWLGGPSGTGECLIVLDECHKAKNLLDAAGNSSQTGLAVESLQDQLPNARVLYSSATGASEPDNLRYMVRLGAFDYPHIGELINALKRSGLGALEMFCMGLKATGTYVSRTLSYKGAEFKTEELQIDPIFSVMYDRSCSLWSLVYNVMRALPKSKKNRGRDMKTSLFWSAHQRFYRQMLIASKVRRCAELAQDALDRGMCVVIGLQSTGEANLNSAREAAAGGQGGEEEGMDDFVSAPKMILHSFISQWLFHFTEPVATIMTKRKMQHLQSEVYRACLEWRKNASAAEEADSIIRLRKREAVQAERAAARAAATAAGESASGAAAAAPAIGSPGVPSAYGTAHVTKPAPRYDELDEEDDDSIGVEIPDSDEEGVALTGGGSGGTTADAKPVAGEAPPAAEAAAQTTASSDSGDELEVVQERTLDDALAERRRRALLAGDLIDLADGDEDVVDAEVEAERQRLLAQADEEEAAEAEATERRKREERRAKLEAALAEARRDAEKARSEVQRLEQAEKDAAAGEVVKAAAAAGGDAACGSAAAATPAAGRRAAAGAKSNGIEDDMDCNKENAGPSDGSAGGTTVVAAVVGSKPAAGGRPPSIAQGTGSGGEEDEDEENRPLTVAARRRRCAAVLDNDEEDEEKTAGDGAAAAAGADGKEQQLEQRAGAEATAAAADDDEPVAIQRRGSSSCKATASGDPTQQRPVSSSGRRAPSGSSAAADDEEGRQQPQPQEQQPQEQRTASQGAAQKRARRGAPAGGAQEEVVSSPLRSCRGAALKAAARIAASAGGTKPPSIAAASNAGAGAAPLKPPRGPSAPKAAATATADKGAKSAAAAVTVKQEPGSSRPAHGAAAGGAPATGAYKRAAAAAASNDDEDESDVIVISDSDAEEAAMPADQTKGGIAAKNTKVAVAALPPVAKAVVKKEPQSMDVDDQEEHGEKAKLAAGGVKGKTCRGVKDKASQKTESEDEDEEEQVEDEEEAEDEVEDEEEEEDEEGDGYDDTMCAQCGGGEEPHTILLCDSCDDGYHMACLDPPLKVIPKGDWYCPRCKAERAAKAAAKTSASGKMASGAATASAGQKRKGLEPSGNEPPAASKAAKPSGKAAKSAAAEDEDEGDEQAEVEEEEEEEAGRGAKRQKVSTRKAVPKAAGGGSKGGKGNAAARNAGAKKAAAGPASQTRQRAVVDDEEDGEDEEDEDSDDEEPSEESAESVEDSDDDDFVADAKGGGGATRGGGRLKRAVVQRPAARGGGKGARESASAAARFAGDSDGEPADANGRGGPAANVFKIRMQLRAARQRLKEAEQRMSSAQKGMAEHEKASKTNRRVNGGNAGGAAGRGNSDTDLGSRSSSSSDDDEGGGGAGPAGQRATRGSGQPAVYRHAVKNKPLDKIPSSWKARGGRGSGRRRAGSDSDDDSDNDDGSSSSVVTLEEEDSSDGVEEMYLVEEGAPGAAGRRGRGSGGQEAGGSALPSELRKCRAMLLRLLEAQELPLNPLDQLSELLGGESRVAEMTGRKLLQVRNDEGRIVCKQRRDDEAQKMVNMAEKNDFMSGRKLVAIISDAASTGISLQADRRVLNQRRRFHITLELPWSADKAIQQFGRSHRSNQASAPEYCLLVTKCGGEYRFAGAVAKRLTSLGALLRGDRRALGASSDLKPYDVDNKYGELAVGRVLECVCAGFHNVAGARVGELPPDLLPPAVAATPPGSVERMSAFMEHMQRCLKTMGLLAEVGSGTFVLERKDSNTSVTKFLNRLLGLQLRDQDLLFQYFFGIMESLIKQARSAGEYEEGVLNLANSAVSLVQEQTVHVDKPTGAVTSYLEVDVDDGLSFEEASRAMEAALADMRAENAPLEAMNRVGFYVSRRNTNVGGTGHPLVVMATVLRKTVLTARPSLTYRIQRPNQVKGHVFTQFELEDKYRKVDIKEGERHWKFWYQFLDRGCLHGNDCVRRRREGKCTFGSRFYRVYLVSGALLPVLRKLVDTVLRSGSKKSAPRVARLMLRDREQQAEAGDTGVEQRQQAGAGAGSSSGRGGAGGPGSGSGSGSGSGTAEGRVVMGLSLTERDAQSFLAATTM